MDGYPLTELFYFQAIYPRWNTVTMVTGDTEHSLIRDLGYRTWWV